MNRKILSLKKILSAIKSNAFKFMIALAVLSSLNASSQTITVSFPGGIDNCMAPTPNAGNYTLAGTLNGKNYYTKGANLRIIWTGSQWEIQGDDPNISGVSWYGGYVNINNTTTPPADCWTSPAGCFLPLLSGAVTLAANVTSINRSTGGAVAVSGTASFTVVFSNTINTLLTSNFVTVNTGAVAGSSVASVSQVNSTTWTVIVNTGTGDGSVGLNMSNGTGTGAAFCNLPFTGQTYVVNNTTTSVTLSAGDIAFTGYNSTGATADDFSFVVLKSGGLPSGTQIYFTDCGYGTVESAMRTGEGLCLWTATSTVAQFTQVKVNCVFSPSASYTVSTGTATSPINNFINLSNSGDQVLAFQGKMSVPTFISGIQMNAETGTAGVSGNSTLSGWDDFTTGSSPFLISTARSAIPPGLTNGTDAVMPVNNASAPFVELDNAIYNCTGATLAATLAALRTSINDRNNWTKQDATVFTTPPSCSFSIAAGCNNPTIPTLNASSTTNCGTVSTTLSIATGTLNDATNWKWYSGSCGGTLVGTGTSISVSPVSTTSYFARGEGGCVTPGSCGSITITVNQSPVISACPANITQCNNHVASWTNPTATGTPTPTVVCSPASGSTFATGTTNVTCTATNSCGSSSCSFNVIINETPVISACPANITQCNNHVATWTNPTATGTPTPTVVCSPASGSTFATGTTSVTCTATNSCGSSSCSFNVTINETPVISACPANITQCDNPVATWTNPTATGTPTATVVCSPASGSTFATGTTSVTCTATNSCGSSSCSFDVTIQTSSVAATSVTSDALFNEICIGSSATLTANGGTLGSGADWKWYKTSCNGTFVGTGTTISVSPTATSTYFVRAEGPCGNTACVPITIIVRTAPPATSIGTVTVPTHACNGNNVAASCNNVATASAYTWDSPTGTFFNGGSSNPFTIQSTSVTVNYGPPNGSGYNICVQGSNACGVTNRKCSFVRGTVNVPGVITPANNRTTECPNSTADYSIAAVSGSTSYTWSITGDATVNGTGTTATVTFGAAWTGGNLCVTANTPCYSSAPRCLTLDDASGVPGAISGSATACPGSSVTYSIPVVTGAATYNWTLPPNTTGSSSSNSILVTFNAGFTTGDIKITTTSICGITSIQKTKTLSSGLAATPASISGNVNGLCGQTSVFSCPSVSGASSYTWTTPGTINSGQSSTSINVSFASFVNGNVCVTANNACGTSATRCVPVLGKPCITGGITYSPGTVCANQAGVDFQVNPVFGTTGYNWTFPTGVTPILNLGNEQIVNWGSTSGNVTVTAANACGNTTRTATITLTCRETAPVSADEITTNEVKVYPNPAHDNINVQFHSQENTSYTINLMDMSGRIINTFIAMAEKGLSTTSIDLTSLSKGVYMLDVKSNLLNKQIRIVVE